MLYLKTYQSDIEPLQKCLNYLQYQGVPDAGVTLEIGDGIRCVCVNYNTIPENEAVWEAHKKYVDLHCVISGEERIGVAQISKCKMGLYDISEDCMLAQAKPDVWYTLTPGKLLCLFPQDVHKVKVRIDPLRQVNVKKIVFKIPVALFGV